MKSILPLFPFVAALSLLACQGDDGPVAEGATTPPDAMLSDAAATGLAAPANAAAAEAATRAALPPATDGMEWSAGAEGVAHYGPAGGRPLLSFACSGAGADRRLVVTRRHPTQGGATGTLSFTGGGHASSMPMRAVATPGGPGESEWRGEASGDMARAVARAFAGGGAVNVSLGGAPSLSLAATPAVRAVLARCG